MLTRAVLMTMSSLAVLCLIAGASFAVPCNAPGCAMSDFEAASVAGADCGYQEDGGGTDWGCCGWCWTGSYGWGSFPEYRRTDGICLAWSATVTCPCGGTFASLGSSQCTY